LKKRENYIIIKENKIPGFSQKNRETGPAAHPGILQLRFLGGEKHGQ